VGPLSNWLIICYRVATEPSALRVATWRALKQMGAVKLGDGVYFLPNTPIFSGELEGLRARIQAGSGSAVVVIADGLSEDDEASLRAAFLAARSDEFQQVQRSAIRLVEHIAREEATDDYRFAEVDALEEELEKVRRQFQRATNRDHLGSPHRDDALCAVTEADRRLRAYLDEAFQRDASPRAADSPSALTPT